MSENVRELIIIGGGPAGYTAALYAARANLEPLVIEGFQWGGQLMITSDVENYPGYVEGVLGPEMMKDFRRQAERFGAEFISDDVTRVDFSERPFRIYVGDEEYRAEAVIVATGANARQLELDSERGCRAAASRTAPSATRRSSAREESWSSAAATRRRKATFLTKFADKVAVVHRREDCASQIMLDRARANEKIDWVTTRRRRGRRRPPSLRCARGTSTPTRSPRSSQRALRRDRPRSEHRALRRPARHGRARLPAHPRRHVDERRRRVRSRRRRRPHLPAGDHRRRDGEHGRARRRALADGPAGHPADGADRAARPARARTGRSRRPARGRTGRCGRRTASRTSGVGSAPAADDALATRGALEKRARTGRGSGSSDGPGGEAATWTSACSRSARPSSAPPPAPRARGARSRTSRVAAPRPLTA